MGKSNPGAHHPSSKLTPQRRHDLLKWLKAGLPIETAARLVDINPATVRQWRARSVEGVRGYARLESEIQQALAEGEAINLARISEAGKTNWRAAAWLLERMYPGKWGPTTVVANERSSAPKQEVIDDFPGL
jgi:hypothetical protein